MNKLKTALVAAAGLVVGAVTVRAMRKQRTPPQDEAKSAARTALTEAEVAAEHAVAALRQARLAGEKTVETARTEYDIGIADAAEDATTDGETDGPLRRVNPGWVRR